VNNKMRINRRSFLFSASAAALALPMVNFHSYQVFADTPDRYTKRTIDLVQSTQVIDMLSTVFPFGPVISDVISGHNVTNDPFAISDDYLQLLLSSGIDVFHPAMGLAAEDVLQFVARLNAFAAEHPTRLHRIDSVDDFNHLKKGERLGFIVGVQNSDHFRHIDDINRFYHLGQRVSQLTYNNQNLIGSGSVDRIDGGLSDYGVQVVERMNEVGMAIDVSHCGDQTTIDTLSLSKKPVLITHSNVRRLVGGHLRCKTDEAIKAMARIDGVMGISGVRNFVRDKEPTHIGHLIDHIDYVRNLVGVESVGVGSDMDMHGYDDMPEPAYSALKNMQGSRYQFRKKIDTDGFDHPKRIYDLTEGLIQRGYSNQDIRLVLGGNFKRVLGSIWIGSQG
jgi:membrane dipeptidase